MYKDNPVRLQQRSAVSYASPCMQIVTAPIMKVLLFLLGVITIILQQLGRLLGGGDGNDIVGTTHTILRRGIASAVKTTILLERWFETGHCP